MQIAQFFKLRSILRNLGILFFLSFCNIVSPSVALAQPALSNATFAPSNHAGMPWRIAYIESRPFVNYAATLANMIMALHRMGWIKSIEGLPYAKGQVDTQVIWNWMALKEDEPYLKFIQKNFYTFDGLKGEKSAAKAAEIIQSLDRSKDADLVLIMGTEAAEKIVAYPPSFPMMVMSTSNAMEAGIVKGAEFSGVDNIWAHMDPYRYTRQINVFHDIFKFKTLGVVFDDDTAGRSFAAIDNINQEATKQNFKVVFENVNQPQKYGTNKKQFAVDLESAFARLAPKVDAVYLGLFIGHDPAKLAQELAPLTQKKIPVFAQQSNDVAYGALMSLARQNFSGVSTFNARAMVRILKGEPLNTIPQIYENSPNIMINLDVAKEIGFRPRFDLLLSADQIVKSAK